MMMSWRAPKANKVPPNTDENGTDIENAPVE